jgi:hypothetical protein
MGMFVLHYGISLPALLSPSLPFPEFFSILSRTLLSRREVSAIPRCRRTHHGRPPPLRLAFGGLSASPPHCAASEGGSGGNARMALTGEYNRFEGLETDVSGDDARMEIDALQVDATGAGSRRRTRTRRRGLRHRVVRSRRSTTIITVGFVAAAVVLAYGFFLCGRLVRSSFLTPLPRASSAPTRGSSRSCASCSGNSLISWKFGGSCGSVGLSNAAIESAASPAARQRAAGTGSI